MGAKRRVLPWYRQAKATKCGGMGGRESERSIVPCEAGELAREDPVEGSGTSSNKPLEGNMPETPKSETVSTKQQRIATLAKQSPQMAFTSLAHYIDLDWLREAFRRTRKDGARAWTDRRAGYAENLEANLQSLLDRAKSGTYRAPPVRRVHIPKGHGQRDPPDRDPDARGQGPPAGGRHGAGADLRAGLSLTVRTGSARDDRPTRRWKASGRRR